MKTERLLFLDGCRAVPAVVVVLGHAAAPFQPDPWPFSGLAVDFFFVLGAFVITHVYAGRQQAGTGFGAFVEARVTRLFPLYLAGLLLGLALFVLKDGLGPRAIASFVLNLFWLPSPFTLAEGWINGIVFNPPGWTLLFQLLANAVWWLLLARLSIGHKWLACALLGALSLSQMHHTGELWGGDRFDNAHLGVLRAMFPFTLGVCLWHAWRRRPGIVYGGRTGMLLATVLGSLLLATFIVPPGMAPEWHVWFKFAMTVLVFPAVVYLGARIRLEGATGEFFAFAGYISYGLYITHYCVIRVMSAAWRAFDGPDESRWAWYVLELVVSIALAWVATRYFEEPVRQWLKALGRRWRELGA